VVVSVVCGSGPGDGVQCLARGVGHEMHVEVLTGGFVHWTGRSWVNDVQYLP
jgi:hypothetical protein